MDANRSANKLRKDTGRKGINGRFGCKVRCYHIKERILNLALKYPESSVCRRLS